MCFKIRADVSVANITKIMMTDTVPPIEISVKYPVSTHIHAMIDFMMYEMPFASLKDGMKKAISHMPSDRKTAMYALYQLMLPMVDIKEVSVDIIDAKGYTPILLRIPRVKTRADTDSQKDAVRRRYLPISISLHAI